MYSSEIVLQNVFDPSVMENALRGSSTLWTSATPITAAATTKCSILIYILIAILITALLFGAIWVFVDWQKAKKESNGFTAS
jgi:ATP-dependent Zn protease